MQCRAEAKPHDLELKELKDGAIDVDSARELGTERASDNSDRVKELRMSVFSSQTTKIPCPRYKMIQEHVPLGKPLVQAKNMDGILLGSLDAMYGTCVIILHCTRRSLVTSRISQSSSFGLHPS